MLTSEPSSILLLSIRMPTFLSFLSFSYSDLGGGEGVCLRFLSSRLSLQPKTAKTYGLNSKMFKKSYFRMQSETFPYNNHLSLYIKCLRTCLRWMGCAATSTAAITMCYYLFRLIRALEYVRSLCGPNEKQDISYRNRQLDKAAFQYFTQSL